MINKKQQNISVRQKLRELSRIKKVSILLSIILFVICYVNAVYTRNINYSFSKETCINELTLFPEIQKQSGSNRIFEHKFNEYIEFGGIKLVSSRTCFSAKSFPSVAPEIYSISPFGHKLINTTYKISIADPPKLNVKMLSDVISVNKVFQINLEAADIVFDYELKIGENVISCSKSGLKILCDIPTLKLTQGQKYELKLTRLFKGRIVSVVFEKSIETVDPLVVTNTSIVPGEIIYNSPDSISIFFDKELLNVDVKIEKVTENERTTIDASTNIVGKQLVVSTGSSLDRDSSYEITVNQAVANDSSTIETPYVLTFRMSDGPGVDSTSVGSTSAPTSGTITIKLDQNILTDQDVVSFITIGGISANVSYDDRLVKISYSNLPLCTDISIGIKAGLVSEHGIVQNDAWSFHTRTVCHTISNIGYSAAGRPVVAYIFGSGSKPLLFVGAIHGNEISSKYLMEDWINELEINARNIPADKKLIIIPAINPDGVALYSRYNKNNIDLNRNFPTDDWQTDIYSVTNQPIPGGGGSAPLSEAESKLLADYTTELNPILTMTFHSSAGYAIGNQAGQSQTFAATYSRLSGYRNMTGVEGAFNYPITGTYDDWVREKLGVTGVLVELSSNSNSQFSKNKSALWAMVNS